MPPNSFLNCFLNLLQERQVQEKMMEILGHEAGNVSEMNAA